LAIAGPRELLYRLALGTGLRRLELKRLQWRDVDLSNEARPCLRLRVEATKSKRADVLPLTASLAARLRAARPADVAPTELVFRLGRTRTVIPKFATWTADLERAGINYKGADDTILGFHSLRVTYVTELQKAGLPPRTVMELARHTDFRLTAGTYTDMRLIDTFGAVANLPDYGPEAAEQVQLRTGTDDRPVGHRTQDQIQDQMGRTHKHPTAPTCSVADFGEDRGGNGSKSRKSISNGKNRGFLGADRAIEKAGISGPETGLLGLEPRTF
jgi:hypothetical protein